MDERECWGKSGRVVDKTRKVADLATSRHQNNDSLKPTWYHQRANYSWGIKIQTFANQCNKTSEIVSGCVTWSLTKPLSDDPTHRSSPNLVDCQNRLRDWINDLSIELLNVILIVIMIMHVSQTYCQIVFIVIVSCVCCERRDCPFMF